MPIQLHELRKPKALKIEFEGEEIHFAYRPEMYTAATEDQVLTMLEQQETLGKRPAQAVAGLLYLLLESWDVMDGEQPAPITAELLGRLSLTFTSTMLDAIMGDMRPNPPTATPSSRSSSSLE